MRAKNLKSLLFAAASAGLVTGAQAQISFGAGGTATYDFTTLPTVADGWSTLSVAGATADITTEAALDAAVNALASTGITTALGTTATVPITANGVARQNSTLGAVQTCPTGNKAIVLMATVRNDSGGDVSTISINLDYANPTVVAGEQVPGMYAYYSLSGAVGSWTKIPELSGTAFGAAKSVVISLAGGPWTSGANLYVLWADDNGTPSPDSGYTIDNFQIGTGTVTPPAIVTQPASTNAPERSVVVLGVGATGTSLTYQWYKGSPASPTIIPGATGTSLRVTNMTGLVRYPWSTPLDNGNYFVRVSGSGSPVDSSVATVTITPDTTAPALSYATCGTGTNQQVILNVSEPLNNAGGEVTDASNWDIRSLDNATVLGIVNVAYLDNGASTAITFDIDPATPRDTTKGYKISLVAGSFINDTAGTANSLTGPASTPVLCFTNIIMNQTAAWKVNDKDVDPIDQLPVSWKDVAYNDTAAPWTTGVGPFDAKRNNTNTLGGVNCRDVGVTNFGAIGTCLNLTSPVTGTNLVTAYFRSHFSQSGSPAGKVFVIYGKFDDGVVMYLNGTEIWRLGVAAGVVTNGTFANRTVNDGDADDSVLLVSPASMVSGNNLLAFSLHQVNLTSSDIYARINVAQLVAEPPAVAPVLTITSSGSSVTISSTVAGTLISSDSITAPRSSWTDEGAIGAGAPGRTITTTTKRFFAVRVP